jgi:hypothetical protein
MSRRQGPHRFVMEIQLAAIAASHRTRPLCVVTGDTEVTA